MFFYFTRCMNTIFNLLLVKYDVHTTRKIKFVHVIIYHILLLLYIDICSFFTNDSRISSITMADQS